MALITEAQVREHWAKIPQAATAIDPELLVLIGRADAILASRCRYPENDAGARTFASSTYTRKIDGPSAWDSRMLNLGVGPVTAVSSVTLDESGGEYTYGGTVASTEYVINAKGRYLLLKSTAAHSWYTGVEANKVVLTAGWVTLPGDLIALVAQQVVHLHMLRTSQGVQSGSAAGSSVQKGNNAAQGGADFSIPPLVAAQLGPYMLWEHVVG